MMKANRILTWVLLASVISIPSALAQVETLAQWKMSAAVELPFLRNLRSPTQTADDRELRALSSQTQWINSAPLTAASLRGKVVLIDFWTYSCINWIRTAPYIRAWAEKYKNQGLVVIGVHTPEFGFEKDIANVRRAVKDMRLTYPIALDNDYTIWRAFMNNAWPALYFVDAHGRVRHHHLGEGEYARSEMMIQKLLAEAGAANVGDALVSVEARGTEAPADWDNVRSPETYVGYGRAHNFASRGGVALDKPRVYASPTQLGLNHWALSGDWTVKKELAALNKGNGRIAHRFHARDLHLVMGSAASGASVRFRVLIDGQPPRGNHGLDVDAQGNGTVTVPRMYQLIRQSGPVADRQFEIEFLDPGVEVFAFTFG